MMSLPEPIPQSFIIKIWLEETVEEAGEARWRGHITHVPGGDRRYIQDLDDIRAFVAPYLEAMGVPSQARQPAGRWMRHLRCTWSRRK